MSRILHLTHDRRLSTSLETLLRADGHELITVSNERRALESVVAELPDVIVIDVPDFSGLETLDRMKNLAADAPVILTTDCPSSAFAIQAMKRGAQDYLVKPVSVSWLRHVIELAIASRCKRGEPRDPGHEPAAGDAIIGNSQAMVDIYKQIGQVATSNLNVLIRGESGTGKELVARAIHQNGPRAVKPFVAINCSAIPEGLLESELFGAEKGAFTGACARRQGRFEQADGGTLFLDEIGDMSLATQAKVLRVIEGQTFERLGGGEAIRTDVRVIAATNHDMERLIEAGQFRADLYFRLDVLAITMPSLRERKSDIPALADGLLRRQATTAGRKCPRVSEEALRQLMAYDWPGNVRELEHCLAQAALRSRYDFILPDHLPLKRVPVHGRDRSPAHATDLREAASRHLAAAPGLAHRRMIEETERELFRETFALTNGNLAKASRLLGISRPTLREKMSRYGLKSDASPEADPRLESAIADLRKSSPWNARREVTGPRPSPVKLPFPSKTGG